MGSPTYSAASYGVVAIGSARGNAPFPSPPFIEQVIAAPGVPQVLRGHGRQPTRATPAALQQVPQPYHRLAPTRSQRSAGNGSNAAPSGPTKGNDAWFHLTTAYAPPFLGSCASAMPGPMASQGCTANTGPEQFPLIGPSDVAGTLPE